MKRIKGPLGPWWYRWLKLVLPRRWALALRLSRYALTGAEKQELLWRARDFYRSAAP